MPTSILKRLPLRFNFVGRLGSLTNAFIIDLAAQVHTANAQPETVASPEKSSDFVRKPRKENPFRRRTLFGEKAPFTNRRAENNLSWLVCDPVAIRDIGTQRLCGRDQCHESPPFDAAPLGTVRKVILASLKAITYASGRAYVALSKGDTAAYLNDLGSIEQSLAAIHAEHRVDHTEEDD